MLTTIGNQRPTPHDPLGGGRSSSLFLEFRNENSLDLILNDIFFFLSVVVNFLMFFTIKQQPRLSNRGIPRGLTQTRLRGGVIKKAFRCESLGRVITLDWTPHVRRFSRDKLRFFRIITSTQVHDNSYTMYPFEWCSCIVILHFRTCTFSAK